MVKNNLSKPTIDFVYNPDNQTKAQLIDNFVVRLKTFQRLFEDIQQASMEHPEQHYLIEGKRGMGKTTLLLRLSYEIENDQDLSKWLIPIVFNEEEYGIRQLYKLWERIAELLEDKCPDFIGLYDEMFNSFNNYESPEEYEYEIVKVLNQRLQEHKKKLILFIDNFGDIFSKFNKQETQRFRTVLQTNTNLRIFGASSKILDAFQDNKHPFYELFKIQKLSGLDKTETQELLLKLGELYKQDQINEIIQNQSGRVEALRRMTGGVIRTIILLSEIFIDHKEGNAFSDMELILDRVTPLYKHRMDDLPAQQQEIASALAFAWDAINVSEISRLTRIPSKTVSAQLRQMEKNELITKKYTDTKNHYYQLSERFFNIWYLMRHSRKSDQRVKWLVRFFEEWCDDKEILLRTNKHLENLKSEYYNTKAAYYISEALASTKHITAEQQDQLLKSTRTFLNDKHSEYARQLTESDLELLEKANTYRKQKEYRKALSCLHKMKKPNPFYIGLTQDDLGEFKLAEKFYLKAVDKDDSDATYNLALLYEKEFKDFKKAEKFYLKAIKNGHNTAHYTLAHMYFSNHTKKAAALNMVEKNDHKDLPSLLLSVCAIILTWNDHFKEASAITEQFIYDDESLVQEFFLLQLAKKQYHTLYKYFTNEKGTSANLKDRFKPIWYALMYYMQDQYPNEYIRMGSELEETVKEIIEKVEQMRIDYA